VDFFQAVTQAIHSVSEDNKRRSPRLRTLKGAKILYRNGWGIVDCVIRDMSETGARLVCKDTAAVPGEFSLLFINEDMVRDARVVWRREDLLGITFTSDKRPAPKTKLRSGDEMMGN